MRGLIRPCAGGIYAEILLNYRDSLRIKKAAFR